MATKPTLLSPRNPRLKELRRLSGRRRSRRDAGLFVIDGPTLVSEALTAGIVCTDAFVDTDADPVLRASLGDADVATHEVGPGVLAAVTDTVTPQGVVAIARTPDLTIAGAFDVIGNEPNPMVLVLVEVRDPGNVGTMLRAAEAAGAAAVLLADSAEVTQPKTVRASAGSLFRVPVGVTTDTETMFDAIAVSGVPTVGTVVDADVAYDSLDLTGPVAVVVGNEAHGLADIVVDRLDHRVAIPMAGRAESLNVAMAGTIMAFEVLRQRRSERP